MNSRGRLHHSTHLAGLQRKGSIFKLLLHLAFAEEAQVTSLAGTTAIRLGNGKIAQSGRPRPDLFLITFEQLYGVLLGPCDVCLSPARGPATAFMLDEEMSSSDLAIGGGAIDAGVGRTVMLGHVDLEFICVGVLGWFPSRLMRLGVEVVW